MWLKLLNLDLGSFSTAQKRGAKGINHENACSGLVPNCDVRLTYGLVLL